MLIITRRIHYVRDILACVVMFLGCVQATAKTNEKESLYPDSLLCDHALQLRTNLLYWLTLTPNLSLDLRVADHWSVGLNYGQNFVPLRNTSSHPHTRRLRHLLVTPEVRYWRKGTFEPRSWFFGLNPLYSHYNVSRIPGIYPSVRHKRQQGDIYALGLFAGYTWRAGRLFRMEAIAGVAGGYSNSKEYDCTHCGTYYGKKEKAFAMPQLALNLVLDPHRKPQPVIPEPIVEPQPEPVVVPFVPYFGYVEDNTGKAGELQRENPILAHISQYQPYDDTRILRKESSALCVFFPLDSVGLRPDFRDNAAILERIMRVTNLIMSDSVSSVKKIQVIGMASIEGSQQHNCYLAENRARALGNYVRQHLDRPTPDSLYEISYACEAWSEFRDQIQDICTLKRGGTVDIDPGTPAAATLATLTPEVLQGITLQEAEDMLQIIDTEPDLDRRERRIRTMNGGRTYRFLLRNVLADQRNSGYLRIYFDYIPDEAARAINRAADLMRDGRYAEALPILEAQQEDPRAWNALGVAYYMTNQKETGIQYFRKAAAAGNEHARKNLQQMAE